jgi:TRAP-type mannitol/chloroaromatic compound transport system permease small subunit
MTTGQKIYLIASLVFIAYLLLMARGYRVMLQALCAENADLKNHQSMSKPIQTLSAPGAK